MKSKYSTMGIMALLALSHLCYAYIYEYGPSFINEDMRLAALGNIDLVIIARSNEINAHVFGNSPAGVVIDNDYRSEITVPGLYGFTCLGDESVDHDWHASQIGIDGVYKYMKKFALGGAFARIDAQEDGTHSYIDGYWQMTTILRSMIGAWQITPKFSVGFEAHLDDLIEEDSTFYGAFSHKTAITTFEPSVLFTARSGMWQVGMDYKYEKYAPESYDTAIVHEFRVPIIYSSPHLNLGVRAQFGTLPDSGLVKAFDTRVLYKLPAADNHLHVGMMCAYQSPMIYKDFVYAYTDGYEVLMGFGLACQVEDNWLLGIQYKKQVSVYTEYPPSYSVHMDQIGMGGEIVLWDIIPIRLGYTSVSSEYISGYAVVTWGTGVVVPGIDLEFAFTHNMYVFKHGFHDETDYDHVFGLAGYFDF
jgi:hypothetical protein